MANEVSFSKEFKSYFGLEEDREGPEEPTSESYA